MADDDWWWVIVWNMTGLFFHILGIIIPIDYCNIFQGASNHQPVMVIFWHGGTPKISKMGCLPWLHMVKPLLTWILFPDSPNFYLFILWKSAPSFGTRRAIINHTSYIIFKTNQFRPFSIVILTNYLTN